MTPAEQEARRRYDHGGFHGGRGLVEDCVRSFVDGAEWGHAPIEGADVVQKIVNAWDCCGTCAGGVLAAHVRKLQDMSDWNGEASVENAARADDWRERAETAERDAAGLRVTAAALTIALAGLQGRVRDYADLLDRMDDGGTIVWRSGLEVPFSDLRTGLRSLIDTEAAR